MDAQPANGWARVAALAARQHGRVSCRQLSALGIGRGAVEKAVRSGRLHAEHRGVYAVGHVAPTRPGRWMSAVLACGPGAALSHRSAAALWRIRDGEGPRVDVMTAGAGRGRPGIAVHRGASPGEITIRQGIPSTIVARTLVDLAHAIDAVSLTRAVREAQYLGLFDLAATRTVHERRPSRALAAILEDFATVSTSWLEDEFLRLLDAHRLPRPAGQRRVGGHRVDFVWEAERVAAELDGAAAHLTLDAFQRDRAQGNLLQLDGWLVLRFTAADLRHRRRRTAALVRQALGRSISSTRYPSGSRTKQIREPPARTW